MRFTIVSTGVVLERAASACCAAVRLGCGAGVSGSRGGRGSKSVLAEPWASLEDEPAPRRRTDEPLESFALLWSLTPGQGNGKEGSQREARRRQAKERHREWVSEWVSWRHRNSEALRERAQGG